MRRLIVALSALAFLAVAAPAQADRGDFPDPGPTCFRSPCR